MKFLIAIFILWLTFYLVLIIVESIQKYKQYRKKLKKSIHKVKNIDLALYQTSLEELEKLYETTFKTKKVVLRDKKGSVINICPKRGGYMRIVRWGRKPFLGCSNYPSCSSYKNYNKIFDLKVEICSQKKKDGL